MDSTATNIITSFTLNSLQAYKSIIINIGSFNAQVYLFIYSPTRVYFFKNYVDDISSTYNRRYVLNTNNIYYTSMQLTYIYSIAIYYYYYLWVPQPSYLKQNRILVVVSRKD